ncbi:MAG TPA: hypothetical protein VJQ54_20370, partial [Candidatus Sulfotelmatobacter sp.]|nr:hypothetical protein [Candidatus Sulfotelmatobacter sp.]
DHDLVSDMHQEVERLANRYVSLGNLPDPEARAFRELVSILQSKYAEHIRIEDSVVFPLAERLLNDTEKTSIAHEMAERRNAPLMTPRESQTKII